MATYRVASWGNDSTGDGSASTPYLTISKACTVATTTADVVEIIDEGDYNVEGVNISANSITVQHTASWLGRPRLYNDPKGGGSAFVVGTYTGCKFTGLEFDGYSDPSNTYVFSFGGTAATVGFEVSGCFIHNTSKFSSHHMAGTSANPSKIKETTMFFEPAGAYIMTINGFCEITNCLLTSSNTTGDWPLIYDYGANGTASFSTFINRGQTTNEAIRISKMINCIVSASRGDGIRVSDHTYNRVSCNLDHWLDASTGASASFGTGELYASTAELAFVDGNSIGNTPTVASNYNLQEGSVAIGNGVTYDSIAIDITGTVRPQDHTFDIGAFEFVASDPDWTEYTTQPRDNRQGSFTLNTYTNLASNQRFRYSNNPGQAPFSRGSKGPSSLRGRTTPYKTIK